MNTDDAFQRTRNAAAAPSPQKGGYKASQDSSTSFLQSTSKIIIEPVQLNQKIWVVQKCIFFPKPFYLQVGQNIVKDIFVNPKIKCC